MPRLYYHCAEPKDRASISAHGLDHRRGGAVDWREHDPEKRELAPHGNYLWAKLDVAESIALEHECDLWVVSLPASATTPDPWGAHADKYKDAVLVKEPIPPDCLALGIAGLSNEQISERYNLARSIATRTDYESSSFFRFKRALGLERSLLAELEAEYESQPRPVVNQQALSGSSLTPAPHLSRLSESASQAEIALAPELALD